MQLCCYHGAKNLFRPTDTEKPGKVITTRPTRWKQQQVRIHSLSSTEFDEQMVTSVDSPGTNTHLSPPPGWLMLIVFMLQSGDVAFIVASVLLCFTSLLPNCAGERASSSSRSHNIKTRCEHWAVSQLFLDSTRSGFKHIYTNGFKRPRGTSTLSVNLCDWTAATQKLWGRNLNSSATLLGQNATELYSQLILSSLKEQNQTWYVVEDPWSHTDES